jgi:hypothetical protein
MKIQLLPILNSPIIPYLSKVIKVSNEKDQIENILKESKIYILNKIKVK